MKKSITLLLIFTTSVLFSQLPSYVPSNGLLGWWPFTGNANDLSGNGNNGTVSGATLTLDRFGNSNSAYNFDGVNDFIEVANNVNLQNLQNFSISVWYKINQWQQVGNDFWFPTIEKPSSFSLELKKISTDSAFVSATSILHNESGWNNLVINYSNNIQEIYSNGLLMSSINNVSLSPSNQPLFFGKDPGGLLEFTNGKIDDIGLWNRALTQQEITNLYTSNLSSQDFAINNINIYPNPTTSILNFKSAVQVEKIVIYNMLGQLVQEEKVNALEGAINIEKLEQGAYLVKVNDIDKGYTIIKN